MPRKLQDWNEIFKAFSNESRATKFYSRLSPRELLILCASLLDLVLIHILKKGLRGEEKEIDSFLGVNGNLDAPCGTFDARIRLAYVVGIINQAEMEPIKAIRQMRNHFAHNYKVSLSEKDMIKKLDKVHRFVLAFLLYDWHKYGTKERALVRRLRRFATDARVAKDLLRLATLLLPKWLDVTLKERAKPIGQ